MTADSEPLTSLSVSELEALAEGLMAPAKQHRLDQLLTSKANRPLASTEQQELDRLLDLVDQLTVVKTRARYTLDRLKIGAAAK